MAVLATVTIVLSAATVAIALCSLGLLGLSLLQEGLDRILLGLAKEACHGERSNDGEHHQEHNADHCQDQHDRQLLLWRAFFLLNFLSHAQNPSIVCLSKHIKAV